MANIDPGPIKPDSIDLDPIEQSIRASLLSRCKHFRGAMVVCGAGVDPQTMRDTSTSPYSYPCVPEHNAAGATCESFALLSDDELEQQVDALARTVSEHFTNLQAGRCPKCGAPFDKTMRVGRCVYASPCGHRLYQGRE